MVVRWGDKEAMDDRCRGWWDAERGQGSYDIFRVYIHVNNISHNIDEG